MNKSQAGVIYNRILSKLMWLDILGGGCIHCGYGKNNKGNLAAIDFHHKDPKTKTASPAVILDRSDQIEIGLCVPVCKTCHKMVEHNQTPSFVGQRGINKREALEKQGNKCVDCGISLKDVVSAFHHLDPALKTKFPTQLLDRYHKDPVTKKEIDEGCIPLCCICHAARHHPKLNLDTVSEYLEDLKEIIHKDRTFYHKKPNKDILLESLKVGKHRGAVAQHFGVDNATVTNWTVSYGIEDPFEQKLGPSKEEILNALKTHKSTSSLAAFFKVDESTISKSYKKYNIKSPHTKRVFTREELVVALEEGKTLRKAAALLNTTNSTFYKKLKEFKVENPRSLTKISR